MSKTNVTTGLALSVAALATAAAMTTPVRSDAPPAAGDEQAVNANTVRWFGQLP